MRSFVMGAMTFWEAMSSFVVDQDCDSLDYLLPFCSNEIREVIPNPWTGICTRLFILLAMTGNLVRRKIRVVQAMRAVRSRSSRHRLLQDLHEEAMHLESQIRQVSVSSVCPIQDTEDEFTPTTHLRTVANCYRLSALLELYRHFPNAHFVKIVTAGGPSSYGTSDWPHSMSLPYHAFILDVSTAILSWLKSIPTSSGTKSSQLFPLLIAAAALKPLPTFLASEGETSVAHEVRAVAYSSEVIENWRGFVRERLEQICRYVRLNCTDNVAQVISEVWYRFDNVLRTDGEGRAFLGHHWLDIMTELHLETMLG